MRDEEQRDNLSSGCGAVGGGFLGGFAVASVGEWLIGVFGEIKTLYFANICDYGEYCITENRIQIGWMESSVYLFGK